MSGFFTKFELSMLRRDMAQTLGPCTLEIFRQADSESETGGPDLADVALKDPSGKVLHIPYRIRPLRTPRTQVQGEQTVVVADWEIKLPWEFTARIAQGDVFKAEEQGSVYTVHFVDDRPDATLCRVEVLRKERAR
ncbi:hypothetical protein UFOVP349_10 [uncultured Caudovirales phage]|uniref:Uncharacterized protein n=1 Tax=uncultured Caudovirales phage TaxID=2100421 RepID=A0A6J5LWS5_9CAUD|nr:hypothetical protein UFOVP349_10 [uncultured Caudovirales phage]